VTLFFKFLRCCKAAQLPTLLVQLDNPADEVTASSFINHPVDDCGRPRNAAGQPADDFTPRLPRRSTSTLHVRLGARLQHIPEGST
jgi:hypothetical protein